MTESAEGYEGYGQLALNAYSVDAEMDQGMNTEISLKSSPTNAIINRGRNITRFSVLSFLGNTHSSLESPTPSQAMECAERTLTTSEIVRNGSSDSFTNEPDVLKGVECYQPLQESCVTSKEFIENVCLELWEQPNPNDESTCSAVQNTYNSILDCQTKNGSDFSSHITQLQISEEKGDFEKKECAPDNQKKNDNIESIAARLSFPHENPVTVYSVLQCLERAQFLTKNILEQDEATSSERKQLPTATGSTIHDMPTNTCGTPELISISKTHKAQQLAANTCYTVQQLSTYTCDTAQILSTNASDTAQLLLTDAGDPAQLLTTPSDTAQLLSTNAGDTTQLLLTNACDTAQLLSTKLNTVDTAHTLSTNTDYVKVEPTTNLSSYTEQLSATKTTDEPLQVPTSTCHTLDRCKISKYDLRNNAKLSYNIDQSDDDDDDDDDDISEYVTSESGFIDSDGESTDSSSGFEQCKIKTPHESHMGVRSWYDPDGYQMKTRTETDMNITSQNLHRSSLASETVHRPNECSTDVNKLIQDKLDERLHNGDKETLTSDMDIVERTGGVVEEQHHIIDTKFDEVMKLNACHVCPVCKSVSGNISEFHEHFRLSYRCRNTYSDCTGEAYACQLCNFKCKGKFGLVRHLVTKRHNVNETINFPANSLSTKPVHALNGFAKKKKCLSLGYCCQICDIVVNRRCGATRHLKIHLKNKVASCSVCKKTFSNDWLLHNHKNLHKTKSNSDVSEVKSAPSSFGSDHLNNRFDGKETLPENKDEGTGLMKDKHSATMAKGYDNRADTNAAVNVLHDVSSSTETAHIPNQSGTGVIKLIQDTLDKSLHNGDKETLTSDMDIVEQTPDVVDKKMLNVRPACDPDGYQMKSKIETDININKEILNQQSFASEKFDGRRTQLTSTRGVVEEQHHIIYTEFDEVMKWNACHVCPVCKSVSGNKSEFHEHFRLSYRCRNTYSDCTGEAYACQLCNFKCKGKFGLVRHLVTKCHNMNETINFPANSLSTKPVHALNGFAKKKKCLSLGYCCQICDIVVNRRCGATRHLKIHLKNKVASCSVCKKTFSNDWLLHNHKNLHKTKSNSDVSEVKSAPSSFGSDHLNSRFYGKETLPENKDEGTGLMTDKHSVTMAKGYGNRADTNTAFNLLHDVRFSKEAEHRPRQCTNDVTKHVKHKLRSQKYAEIEQMDNAEDTQDMDDKMVSQVRSVTTPNENQKHTTATKTNTTKKQVKLCFAFEISKLTKKMIFEQTAKSHRYLEMHQLLKWNATHGCPICKTVSRNQNEFHTHFVKSKKCRLFFLNKKSPRAKFSCKPCSYLNKTFSRFLGHLMKNRKHGELTCETVPTSDNKTDADEEYRSEENANDKDNVTGNSEVDARDDGELANQLQSENEDVKRQSHKAGTNMNMHQSRKFKVGFSCQICGAVRFKIATARRHLHQHTDNTLYECQTCNDHLILKGKFSPEHCCRNCGSKCFSLRSKSSGKLVSRSLQKAYQCRVCNEHFFELHDLNVHMRHHVATDCTCGQCLKKSIKYAKKEPHPVVNKCNLCEKVFKCRLSLNLHYQSHSESAKPFMCDTCGEHFANKPCLSSHIRRKHWKTKNCRICRKAVDRDLLRIHMKLHPSESKYTCDRCGKMFKQDHHLANHMLSHSSERSFICKFCGYAFKMKHHMQSHIMTRHKDRKRLPVQETKEDVTYQPVATKRKRNPSTCGKKIVNKHGKVTLTEGTRKRTLTAVDSSTI